MKTHRVLNTLSKCANVRYRKNQMFLWFTINSQSKLKKFSTLLPQRYVHNLERYWENSVVSVLRILLICKFLNFTVALTKKI